MRLNRSHKSIDRHRDTFLGYVFQDGLISLTVLLLVSGSLLLAVIDKESRPMFSDLTKVGLGTYLGVIYSSHRNTSGREG